jgi:hypothetical protein
VLLLRRRFGFVGQAGALLVQKRRHLMPGRVVAHADVGHHVDQQALAMLPQILGAGPDSHRVGDPDVPVPGDPVLDVHRTHCGEGKVEGGDQRHHRREGHRERVGQRHRVSEAQARRGGIGRHV